jgi:hypothetical protein
MLMRAELPIDHAAGGTTRTKDLVAVGVFTIIGLVAALGFAIAFPISTDSAVLLAQLGG